MFPRSRTRPVSRRPRRGAAVLETALILNVLLLGILGVFEYGRIVMLRQLMENAAREGARLAVVGTASTPEVTTAQIQACVVSYMAGQSISNLSVSVYQANPATGANIGSWDQAPYGGAIAVKITATYRPIVPTTFGIVPNPLPMTIVSMMLSEAN
ncbi:TadE-like protein [Aquisphaera giovannonii]|uniref:TadE-like protein n=1 Tax=Aquisphaera giovannonii TaxID=406548 RepID=A0A5B9VZ64_9BACT|nr:TadE/TadG family type IV pilus assembly protein [Aquisphaera giovannonii]QEH32960.1 TadE-like protein [Aquisphaera giovannonii]